MNRSLLKKIAIGVVLAVVIFSGLNIATYPVNLKYVNEATALHILKYWNTSNVTVYNITPNGEIAFAFGVNTIHGINRTLVWNPTILITIINSKGSFPLTNIGVSISNITLVNDKYVTLMGYTIHHSSTLENVTLHIEASLAGSALLGFSFTLTPAYEFLIYHYPGKSETFTLYQNITVTN